RQDHRASARHPGADRARRAGGGIGHCAGPRRARVVAPADRVRVVVLLPRSLAGARLPQLAPSPPPLGAMGAHHRASMRVARRGDVLDAGRPIHGIVHQRAGATPAALVAWGPRVPWPRAPGARAAPTARATELLQRTPVRAGDAPVSTQAGGLTAHDAVAVRVALRTRFLGDLRLGVLA